MYTIPLSCKVTGGIEEPSKFLRVGSQYFDAALDGVTDDSETLQEAFDYAYQGSGELVRGAVEFKGNLVATAIEMHSDTWLKGDGTSASVFIIKPSSTGAALKRPTASVRAYRQRVTDLRMVFTGANQTAIDAGSMGYSYFENIHFTPQPRTTAGGVGEALNLPSSYYSGTVGIRLYANPNNSLSGDSVVVKHIYADHVHTGCLIEGGHGHQITDFKIDTCHTGIKAANISSQVPGGVKIHDPQIQRWDGCGIDVDFYDSIIRGGYFESASTPAIRLASGAVRNIIDADNRFWGVSGTKVLNSSGNSTNTILV